MADLAKRVAIRSKKLRNAARGQACTLQFPGICNGDPETTVLAHIHDDGFGKGIKADDISGVHACGACHMALDEHRTGLEPADLEKAIRIALQCTVRRLIDMGLVVVPRDVERAPTPLYGPKHRWPKRPFGGHRSNAKQINEAYEVGE